MRALAILAALVLVVTVVLTATRFWVHAARVERRLSAGEAQHPAPRTLTERIRGIILRQ